MKNQIINCWTVGEKGQRDEWKGNSIFLIRYLLIINKYIFKIGKQFDRNFQWN